MLRLRSRFSVYATQVGCQLWSKEKKAAFNPSFPAEDMFAVGPLTTVGCSRLIQSGTDRHGAGDMLVWEVPRGHGENGTAKALHGVQVVIVGGRGVFPSYPREVFSGKGVFRFEEVAHLLLDFFHVLSRI
jgi:hypothetical protein